MNFAQLLASALAGGLGVMLYFYFFDTKRTTKNSNRTKSAASFNINFDHDRLFDTRYTPAEKYSNRCTYLDHLRAVIDLIGDQSPEVIYKLKDQEAKMIYLIENLTESVRETGFEDVGYLRETIDGVYASYDHNRADAIEVIRLAYYSATKHISGDSSATINDIAHDNERIIASLDELLASIRSYNAESNGDETPDHITDFTSVEQLERLNQRIKDDNSDASTRISNFTTMVGTNQPLQHQSDPDDLIFGSTFKSTTNGS